MHFSYLLNIYVIPVNHVTNDIQHSTLLLALVKVMTDFNQEQQRFKLQCNAKIERHKKLENQAANEEGFQINSNLKIL